MIGWLYFHMGLNSGNSPWYLFPSGIGGIVERLIELIVIGGLIYRRTTCHAKWWCWRHPHFTLEGSPYKICGKHHPDEQMTYKQAVAHHKRRHEQV